MAQDEDQTEFEILEGIPARYPADQVDRFLQKNYHCVQCSSSDLETFHTENSLFVGSLPDTKLSQFIPNIPYVCSHCGTMGLIWAKTFLERIDENG